MSADPRVPRASPCAGSYRAGARRWGRPSWQTITANGRRIEPHREPSSVTADSPHAGYGRGMFEDDYILRMVKQLAAAIARIAGLNRRAEHDQALAEADRAWG